MLIETTHLLQKFRVGSAEDIGLKSDMEDTHFHTVDDQGNVLAAVFDGHGGDEVAEYAKRKFPALFAAARENMDAPEALKAAIANLQAKIEKKKAFSLQGATAVISFIDVKTNMIYTAALGDSEAHLYRGEQDIKISENLDWGDKSEAKRLGLEKEIEQYLKNHPDRRKYIRSQGIDARAGVNVSRSLGDVKEKAVSHEPTLMEHRIQKGDMIVLSSDGLTDYSKAENIGPILRESKEHLLKSAQKLTELNQAVADSPNLWKKICNFVLLLLHRLTQYFSEKNIAESIVDSVKVKHDNITALIIEVL
jgi:serine/threonine protein phosphatase PrpC